MKRYIPIALSFLLLLAGCDYEVPLTSKADIPVNRELLGLWEFQPSEDDETSERFTMLVLKFSDTEYMVKYGKDKEAIYLRAYHVKLDGLSSIIQIECIGFQEAPIDVKNKFIYTLIRYKLEGNNLEIKIINDEIIDVKCKSIRELKRKILANKNNKELFHNPGIFRKISR